jgi:hypothetical protein
MSIPSAREGRRHADDAPASAPANDADEDSDGKSSESDVGEGGGESAME